MNLTRLAVERPVGVSMLVAALVILAVVALQGLGLDLLPNLEFPYIAVVTVYPGADPQSVESDVTIPIEDALATVAGLKRLTSQSSENLSFVLAEFAWGSNLEGALRQIQANVATVAQLLPDQAAEPVVVQADPSQLPVMLVAVSGGEEPVALTQRVESLVKPRLEQLEGVAAVSLLGGAYEEVTVAYDSEALRARNLTPTLLQQVLAFQNVVVPAGMARDGDRRLPVKAGSRFESLEELRNQILGFEEPEATLGFLSLTASLPVRLRDVADVAVQPRPREGATLVNGESALVLRILKRSGENSVAVAERLRNEIEALQADLDLNFHVLTDQAELINNSLENVASSGVIGGLLAILSLLLFLRRFAPVAIIAVTIPLAALGALAILRAAGVTLNLMSLGGLALAVGMVVDNTIVVIESVVRHLRMGKPPRRAAQEGSAEVASAIVASTVTTVVVFLPIGFVQSLAGRLFKDMGIAVAAALTASLAVALIVVPSAASRWLSPSRKKEAKPPSLAEGLREAAASLDEAELDQGAGESPRFERLRTAYERLLERWLEKPWLTPLAIALCLAALLLLPASLASEFLPSMDGGLITLSLEFPAGTGSAESIRAATQLEQAIRSLPEVETVALMIGDQGSQDIFSMAQGIAVNRADFTVVLSPREERSRSADEVASAIASLPVPEGARLRIEADRTQAALGDDFFPGVTLHFSGPDLDRLKALADEASKRLASAGGFGAIHLDLAEPEPELFFEVTERSFQGVLAGGTPLTAGQVGLSLRNHLTGATATHVSLEGKRLPVVVRARSEEQELEALRSHRVADAVLQSTGTPPILERISVLHETESPPSIRHLNRIRTVTLRAELDGIGLGDAKLKAEAVMDELSLPPGYRVTLAGIHAVLADSQRELAAVAAVAIALVFIAMAIQFESVRQPLITLVTIPLAAAGAFGALKFAGHTLNLSGWIGLILLFGIAVNHGIVMIDYINQLRRGGLPLKEAAVKGAGVRLRPILMTSITTIFGLIPLAFGTGSGSELQAPMAVAVIGGLTTSVLISLFVVPGLVLLLSGRREPHLRQV